MQETLVCNKTFVKMDNPRMASIGWEDKKDERVKQTKKPAAPSAPLPVMAESKRKRLNRFVTSAVGKGREAGILKLLKQLEADEVADLKWLDPSDFNTPYISSRDKEAFLAAISYITTPSAVSISPSGTFSLHSSQSSLSAVSGSASTASTNTSTGMAWNGEFPVSLRSGLHYQKF
eukprot:TRINITY_DN25338_c0_g1_i1.p1 TRINITY_DN25338_c0_g1~~TRINITY_DN25338_c0_g1_i1.p1  ORF type:complete len:196 (+),score=59.91 TRINITY_DN25338_c0_g1_i1:62-589(+)